MKLASSARPSSARSYVIYSNKSTPHHRPARLLVVLVVLVLPGRAAAVALVTGDGDGAGLAVFLAVAALHQLGMAGRLAPVALDALAGLAQFHRVQFALSGQFFAHGRGALVVCGVQGRYCKPHRPRRRWCRASPGSTGRWFLACR